MAKGTMVWERAEPPQIINHAYSEEALIALERTFGPYPATLGADDLRILRAMDMAGGKRPINDLILLIEKYGKIRVWVSGSEYSDIVNRTFDPFKLAL